MDTSDTTEPKVPNTSDKSSARPEQGRGWYRHYALGILGLVYASSFMDRQITSILIEDLKLEFSLSDAQLGLLSGLAFALFYATLGLPIARLADRYNRINIITIAITVWSLMTALSAAAGSYGQLLAARIGVGVGEAGSSPPSHSIISDYYEPNVRSLALSVWAMGAIFGSLAGIVLGGVIAENYGWRMAFLAAGLPGLVLAVIVKLTVREPIRGLLDKESKSQNEVRLDVKASLIELWRNRVYRFANIANLIAVFFGYSIAAWAPALFIRHWGLSQSEVGVIVGGTLFIAGIGGLLAGGAMASYMARRDPAWEAWVPAIGLFLGSPIFVVGLLSESAISAAVLFGISFFFYQCSNGPGLAIVQSSVRPNMRAFAAAVLLFTANLLALGLGPLIVGLISDLQLGDTPGASLAIAMGVGPLALLIAAMGFWYLGFLLRRPRADFTNPEPVEVTAEA